MSIKTSILSVAFLIFLSFSARAEDNQGEIVLVQNGKPTSVVLMSSEKGNEEELTIQELNLHIQKMTGVSLPVIKIAGADLLDQIEKTNQAGQVPIVLGRLAMNETMEKVIRSRSNDPASFVIDSKIDQLRIAGLSTQGTLNGVYEILEQMGCRWFMPGDFGTVIPKAPNVRLRIQQTVQFPSFAGRTLQMIESQTDWYRRMRLGGKPVPGAHGTNIGKVSIEEHPELFALCEGKRTRSQLCISNPEVLRRAIEQSRKHFRENPDADIIGMGPGDGREFCECQRCRALDAGDWDPFAKIESITDRYVWFFNSVLDAISDEFPQKSIAFYAYDGTMRPPVKVKPNPRIIPVFALIRVCHIHGMSNPVCPERDYYKTLLTQWSALVLQSFDRDYLLNYSGYPIAHAHRSRDEIPLLQKYGITRVRRQTWPCWGNMSPGIYVTAKLLWNADANVDALEQDFYEKFFGPASAPMARYFKRVEAAYYDADTHPRWENVDMALIMPPAVMESCKSDLTQAASLASDDIFAKRIAAFRLMHDSLDTYLATIGAQERFDFTAARGHVLRLVEMQQQAMQHNPPLMFEPTTRNLQQSIEDAYTKTTGNGRMLVGINPRWDFMIDPTRVGEDLKYWQKDLRGGNWDTRLMSSITLKAIVSDWDQELRWYLGEAWYRTIVEVPKMDDGTQPISLWLRRIPKGSKIWLNGRLIGEADGTAGYMKPYDLDVTETILTGQKNTLAIKATGPVHGPVMLYTKPAPVGR